MKWLALNISKRRLFKFYVFKTKAQGLLSNKMPSDLYTVHDLCLEEECPQSGS